MEYNKTELNRTYQNRIEQNIYDQNRIEFITKRCCGFVYKIMFLFWMTCDAASSRQVVRVGLFPHPVNAA